MGENNGMSNFEKWRVYTDGLASPDSFINFSFYYLISAALQRRVWLPPAHKPIFCNLYGALITPPGIGKGLILGEVAKFLKYHKRENPMQQKNDGAMTVDRQVEQATAYADYLEATSNPNVRHPSDHKPRSSYKTPEEPLLALPMAADATTYEALVTATSRALRRKNYTVFDPVLQRNVINIYTHSSIAFCLEEMSSLFKRKAEDALTFLNQAFDCGDYRKETKTQGIDKIQRCCMCFLGGATFDFMRRMCKDEIINEGFTSRSIFVCEFKERKIVTFIPELTPLQLQYEKDLLAHIKLLINLYGQVEIDDDAKEFLEKWHRESQANRPNINPKLLHYHSRKKIHLMKLAAAVHFGESTELRITLHDVKVALAFIDSIEKNMHLAIVSEGKNPYHKLSQNITQFLMEQPRSLNELRAFFWDDLPNNDPYEALSKTLQHLVITGRITEYPKGGKTVYETIKVNGRITKEDILRETESSNSLSYSSPFEEESQ